MPFDSTIFAVSSAGGTAGGGLRAIVRITGSDAWRLGEGVLVSPPTAGEVGVSFRTLRAVRLPTMVVRFKGPRSYTGEDVMELHVAGSGSLLRQLEQSLREAGGRHAEPGEFSARAFFNGKIDLTEAEGIAATIGATNRMQLRAAAALREGALHRWTGRMADQLAETLALLEAGIDFTDEEGVSFISADGCAERLGRMVREMESLMRAAVRWERVDSMPTVVLTGEPNVGKSSLLNALTGRKRAIVSEVAGTTRDALSATMQTARGVVRVVDVAGMERAGEGLRDAMNESRGRVLREADLVVLVTDARTSDAALDAARAELRQVGAGEVMVVRNKCDLGRMNGLETEVSALTGEGIEALRCEIGERLGRQARQGESAMTLNGRNREALWEAMRGLRAAERMCGSGNFSRQLELVAAEIRMALNAVGSISGTVTADEVLGRIFSRFCIGK